MERKFHQLDFFHLFWHALQKNSQEPQTPGFVGGYISHAETWKLAHRKGVDWIFIAEDDCMPNGGICEGRAALTWPDVYRIAASMIVELRASNVSWDILYVG